MPKSEFEQAHAEVKKLVSTFQANEQHYLAPAYAEAQARQDFIDKFFVALGWDVLHNQQKNPFQQEVKVEKPQKQEGTKSQKRADYAFSLAPNYRQTQFFVEAKKPSRLLEKNKNDYFQTAKYGWNSQTGVSILTDFEELVVIDARLKPDFDTVLKNELKYYKYTDFLDPDIFSEFYWLFSREAVAAGNLKEYIEHLPKPKGKEKQLKLFGGKYQSIDESFLEYIDEVRKTLAVAVYQNNPNLQDYELTEATQRVVDRLVFMRFLEDKQIEPETLLHTISTSNHPWQKFIEVSRRLDAKYNGIVFKKHFIDDKQFLGANNQLFQNITAELDHTNTPYDFNYIPIHILGNIYERFLGKVITVNNGKAEIELKPEVRKAGGVYYTPQYIVNYIVQNTIGKQIAGKTPKQIADMKFADIASGSGSFLIGAYDYLLNYHTQYYNQHPAEAKKAGSHYNPETGSYTLSIQQKQHILLNNIYGVDIDQQATEVTQISLFLKLLEDETMATANDMNVLFHEKILPDLSNNIKSGNSLVGWDVMDGVLEFGQHELRKLNPFDFKQAFPQVFKNGGFDAIIGNPPYVNIEKLGTTSKNYFFSHYSTALGRTDIYILFLEKYLSILKKKGKYGVIIPHAFTNQNYGKIIRNKILLENQVEEITDTSNYFVFKDAVVKNISLFVNKEKPINQSTTIKAFDSEKDFLTNHSTKFSINQNEFLKLKDFRLETKNIYDELDTKLKIDAVSVKLNTICFVAYGARLNFKDKKIGKEYFLHSNYATGYKPYLEGKNIHRYYHTQEGWLNYQPALHYNSMFKELFESEKLMTINVVSKKARFCYDNEGFYNSHTVINCVKLDELKDVTHSSVRKSIKENGIEQSKKYNLKSILGILNSSTINWYFKQFLSESLHFYPNDVKQLPIPKITEENQSLHNELVNLVEQMLQAKAAEQHAKTELDKNIAAGRTQNLDNRINQVVYQLYNLSPAEVALIEAATAS